MHFVFGYIMAIVFQLAHLVPKTKFVEIDEKNRKVINVEDEWVIHQLNTTCDFAHKNKVISWLVGGLNFQTEHHLFVKISHIHYPVIAKIVKDFTQKHSLQYNEYETLEEAVNAHFSFLKVEIV